MSITANFAAAPPRVLTVTPNGNGTVGKVPDKTSYLHGESVVLTPMPGVNATFTGWSGDAVGSTNPLTVVMDADKTIVASFADNVYTLVIPAVANGHVDVEPVQSLYYHGQVVTLTPVPDTGYVFNGWSGDLVGSATPGQLTMLKNSTVTPSFISGESFSVNVAVAGRAR
jgi:hypothetical protein